MRISDNYLATINTFNPCYKAQIAALREVAKNRGCGIRIRGRLGENNPYRHLYARGGELYRWCAQDIKLEHSTRVDVYLRPPTRR